MHTRISLVLVLLLLVGCSQPPAYSPELLQQWNTAKAEGGPTFAGSSAWHTHMDFLGQGFAAAGVVDVARVSVPYRRWWAPDSPMPQQRKLVIKGESLPVASYWAYSGSTPDKGVTAPLIGYNKKLSKADLQNHIVVFQVGPVPEQMASMFKIGHEYATDDFAVGAPGIAGDQWYQGNYVTRFGRYDEVLRDSGAAGAIVIFSLSEARLRGLYTFPLLNLGINGVPGIYVDAATGRTVLQAAEQGAEASLTLLAFEEDVQPYFYTAVLPGRDYGTDKDEQLLLVTHSDGPNLTQENGTLGILALLRHYARLPQSERGKSLRVLLDPQHYSPGRHTFDWYAAHPEIMRYVVASVGVEQLGQLEYGEDENGYGLTGLAEPMQIFVRNDPQRINAAISAVESSGVPRTEIRVPEIKGQGRWTGLGEVALKYDLDGYATLTNMSGYWGTTAGIESFDAQLATQQLDMLVMLIDDLLK
jgi:hypothetical protein